MDRSPTGRLHPAREGESDSPSFLLRAGHGVAVGVMAAAASSLLPAVRSAASSSAARVLGLWLGLSVVAVPASVAWVMALRRARVGLRWLAGGRILAVVTGVLWWLVIEISLLSVVGALLRKTTHHRPLAGVAFAAFALLCGAVIGLLARKVAIVIEGGTARLRKIALALASGSAVVVVVLAGVRTWRAEGLPAAAMLLDAFALTTAGLAASSHSLTRSRSLAIAGAPMAVGVLVAAVLLPIEPGLRDALSNTAPLHALLLSLVGR